MNNDLTIRMPAVKIPAGAPCHSVIPVTSNSPRPLRRAVYQIACYFRRESHYDFVQYGENEDDDDHVAFLFVDSFQASLLKCETVGACCFRWREWRDHPPGWALQWIWLHPFRRRRGLLKQVWGRFRTLFGDFLCEPPLSHAMQGFLAAHQDAAPADAEHLMLYLGRVARHPKFIDVRTARWQTPRYATQNKGD